jgi:hypothetical protein
LLLLGGARAQTTSCCSESVTQLQRGETVSSFVTPGTWTDFFFVSENDDQSLAFEVVAHSKVPTALAVYVYDGKLKDVSTSDSDGCVICEWDEGVGEPTNGYWSNTVITTVESMHPDGESASSYAALDYDLVSHVGNTTHTRYFAYVGECYQMKGSVYYLSVYGQTSSNVSFTATVTPVTAALDIASGSNQPATTGEVCDGKYMHYYVDWETITSGGMYLKVKKTSGELESFYVRREKCAGASSENLVGPINLASYGLASGHYKLPTSTTSLKTGRYYIGVRGSIDLCGEFTVLARNLTQHEFHNF